MASEQSGSTNTGTRMLFMQCVTEASCIACSPRSLSPRISSMTRMHTLCPRLTGVHALYTLHAHRLVQADFIKKLGAVLSAHIPITPPKSRFSPNLTRAPPSAAAAAVLAAVVRHPPRMRSLFARSESYSLSSNTLGFGSQILRVKFCPSRPWPPHIGTAYACSLGLLGWQRRSLSKA